MFRIILGISVFPASASSAFATERYKGVLSAADSFDRIRSGCRADVEFVSMIGGRTYTVLLESMDFDPFVRVESPEGASLAGDDDGAGARHARLVFRAPRTGNYRVIATTFRTGATGRYTMHVLDGEWVVDRLFQGSLQRTDPIYRVPAGEGPRFVPSGSHFDAYDVMMLGVPRPNRYLIHLLSKDFDTFLIVERNFGGGTARWSNDDALGWYNAGLDSTRFGPINGDRGTPGLYRLVVLSYRSGATGDYVLRVLREVRRIY